MCGYFCSGFIGFMLAGKTLTEFTNLFLQDNFKKNDDIILKHFMTNVLNRKYKIESYFVRCTKYTKNINPRVLGTSNGKTKTLSNCAICGSKNQDLWKIQKQKKC